MPNIGMTEIAEFTWNCSIGQVYIISYTHVQLFQDMGPIVWGVYESSIIQRS